MPLDDPALVTEWLPAYYHPSGSPDPAKPAHDNDGTPKTPLAKLRTPTGRCPACFNYPNCDHDAPVVFCVTLDGVADTNKPAFGVCYETLGSSGYVSFRYDRKVSLNQTYFVSHYLSATALGGSYSCTYFYINNPGDPHWLVWEPPLVLDPAHPDAFDSLRIQNVVDPTFTSPPDPSGLPTPTMVASGGGGIVIAPTFGVLVSIDNPYTGDYEGELILTVTAGVGTQNALADWGPQFLYFFGQVLLPGPGCVKDAPYIVPNVLAQRPIDCGYTFPLNSGVVYGICNDPTDTTDIDTDTGLVEELRGTWLGVGGHAVVRPLLGIPLDSCNTYRVYNCCTFWWFQWNCYTNSTVAGVVKYMPAECAEATPHAFQQLGKPDDSTGQRIFSYLAITSNAACDGIGQVCADDDTPPSPPTPPTDCPTCPVSGGCEAYKLHFSIGGVASDDLVVRDGTTQVWTSARTIADCFRGSQRITITSGGGSALFLKVIHGDALDFGIVRWVKINDTIPGGCEYLGGECATCPTDTSGFCQRMGVFLHAEGAPIRIILTWSGGSIVSSDARLVVGCEDGVYTMNFTYDGVSYVWKAGAAMDGSFPFGVTNWTAEFDDLDISLDEVACWDCDDACATILVEGQVNGVAYNITITKSGCVWTGTSGGKSATLTGYGKTSILNVHVGVDVGEVTEDRQATFLITSTDNDPTNMTSYTVYTPTDADPPNTLTNLTCGGEIVCVFTWLGTCAITGDPTVTLIDTECDVAGNGGNPLDEWYPDGGNWLYVTNVRPSCTSGEDCFSRTPAPPPPPPELVCS